MIAAKKKKTAQPKPRTVEELEAAVMMARGCLLGPDPLTALIKALAVIQAALGASS